MSETTDVTCSNVDEILQCATLVPSFCARIQSTSLFNVLKPDTEMAQFVVAKLLYDFYEQYKTTPNRKQFVDLLTEQYDRRSADDTVLQDALKLIDWIFSAAPSDLLVTRASKLTNLLLFSRRISPAISEAKTHSEMEAAVISARSNLITEGEAIEPFKNLKLGVEARSSRRTCVPFIDSMLGGGARPGEVYGLIAPSGGGKTTLATQVALGTAKQGRHVLFFSYEDSPQTAEYMIPVYAAASGLSKNVFDKPADKLVLSPGEEHKFNLAKEQIGGFLHYFDCSGAIQGFGDNGIAEVASVVDRYIRQGIKIEAVFLDWFWVMVMKQFKGTSGDVPLKRGYMKTLDRRTLAQEMFYSFSELAKRTGIWIWINQQAAPSEARSLKMNWTNSAEFKSFGWFCNSCFGLSAFENDGVQRACTLSLSKARGAQTVDMPLTLIGDHAVFKSHDEDFRWDKSEREAVRRPPPPPPSEKTERRNKVYADVEGFAV